MVFAYFAPEAVLPATSALATAAGFVMLFGRRAARPVGRLLRRAIRRDPAAPRGTSAVPAPHLAGLRAAGTVAGETARADS